MLRGAAERELNRVLEGLEQVDWTRLSDAYGSAEQVPEDIRSLVAPDGQARKQALGSLHSRICHQGSRYRASAPAVPFLFEVLQAPDTPGRECIVELLVQLAVGYPENHLTTGFNPEKAFAAADRLARKVDLEALRAAPPEEEEDDYDPGRVALWERDAYEAVERRVGVFQQLARSEEDAVRLMAMRALAWFPRVASDSIALLREIVRAPVIPADRANAVLCLGLLGSQRSDRASIATFRDLLGAEHPEDVRIAAALSLALAPGQELPDEALELLLATIERRFSGAEGGALAGWGHFGPVAQAAGLVAAIRPKPTLRVVTPLCRAAETDDTDARAAVWAALLSVVFRKPKSVKFVKDPNERTGLRMVFVDPARLTRNQVRALKAIGRNPLWERWESFPDHHQDLCIAFGLPWQRDRYRALLAAIPR